MWNSEETAYIAQWLFQENQEALFPQVVLVARGPRGWWAIPFLRQLIEQRLMEGLDETSEIWIATRTRLDRVDWVQLRDFFSHNEAAKIELPHF